MQCYPSHAGYDKTVVLTSATEAGYLMPMNRNKMISADDVVSSIRWHDSSPMVFSWTEDGGAFKLHDARANETSINVPLHRKMVIISAPLIE